MCRLLSAMVQPHAFAFIESGHSSGTFWIVPDGSSDAYALLTQYGINIISLSHNVGTLTQIQVSAFRTRRLGPAQLVQCINVDYGCKWIGKLEDFINVSQLYKISITNHC